jgi:hypothetical protein
MTRVLPLALALVAACGNSAEECVDDAAFFEAEVVPLLAGDCMDCHVADGVASETRQVFEPFRGGGTEANRALLEGLIREDPLFAQSLLEKPFGEASHGGGRRFALLGSEYRAMHEFVARTLEPGGCGHPGEPPPTCEPGVLAPSPAPLRRITDIQAETAIRDLLDVQLPSGVFPPSERNKDFRTFAANNGASNAAIESMMFAAEAAAAAADLEALRECGDASCTRSFLLEVGSRAFRRPLTEGEAAVITGPLDAGVAVDDAARMGLEIILQSPQFLYLDLSGELLDEASLVYDDYAVATRLSLFMTDGPPDDLLWDAAESGALRTRDQVRSHAVRLLEDGRMVGVVQRFHQDWLDLYLLDTATRDPDRYPQFSTSLVESMIQETDLFTGEVVWLGEGTFDALLFGQQSWVDPDLANIYGLSDISDWERVQLGEARPGVLTRPAFLASHSYSATSSPVRRGAFVLEQLLCEDLQPPPDVNMDLPEQGSNGGTTIRDRLEAHWTDPACAACHTRIDPIGFSFENFDALGAWRETWEDGTPIDATGTLEEGESWSDAHGMLDVLASSERARECYAQRWFEYAVGRPARLADACTLTLVQERFVASGGDIRGLIADIASSDAMRFRKTEAP